MVALILLLVHDNNIRLTQETVEEFRQGSNESIHKLNQDFGSVALGLDDASKKMRHLVVNLYESNFSALLSSLTSQIFPYTESFDYDPAVEILTRTMEANKEIKWIVFITAKNPEPSDIFEIGKKTDEKNSRYFEFKHPDKATYLKMKMQTSMVGLQGVEQVMSLFSGIIKEHKRIVNGMEEADNIHIDQTHKKALLIGKYGENRLKYWIVGLMIGTLVFLAIVMAVVMKKLIVRPLMYLVNHLLNIEKTGDFSIRARSNSNDEVGQALEATNSLMLSLETAFKDIQKSNNYINNILSSMTDTLLVVSAEGIIKQINRAEILGYSTNELIGTIVGKLFAESGTVNFNRAGLDALVRSGTLVNADASIVTRDRHKIPVLVSGSVLRDTENKVIGVIIVAKDISDYQKTRQELEQQTWLITNTSTFGRVVLEARTITDLAPRLISELTPFLEAAHGVMHVLDSKTKQYRMLGSFGYLEQEGVETKFAANESLGGQCAAENRIIHLKDIPDSYYKINSGLGNASPHEIILVPISFQEKVLAVIELASFNAFQKHHIKFLEELIPILGLGLDNMMQTHKVETLYQSDDEKI